MTIRITALITRRADLTWEEFDKHWSDHAALFMSLKSAKINLIRYTQFHIDPVQGAEFAKLGIKVAPYDGAAEFEMEKVEDMLAIFGDSEYQEKVIPDELKFLDRSTAVIMIGEGQTKYQKK